MDYLCDCCLCMQKWQHTLVHVDLLLWFKLNSNAFLLLVLGQCLSTNLNAFAVCNLKDAIESINSHVQLKYFFKYNLEFQLKNLRIEEIYHNSRVMRIVVPARTMMVRFDVSKCNILYFNIFKCIIIIKTIFFILCRVITLEEEFIFHQQS